jgi:hypothetical protein
MIEMIKVAYRCDYVPIYTLVVMIKVAYRCDSVLIYAKINKQTYLLNTKERHNECIQNPQMFEISCPN